MLVYADSLNNLAGQAQNLLNTHNSMDSLHQDKSGYICSKEFGSLLRTLGYNPTEAEVNSLMAKVDVDHNGKVFIYLILLVHFHVVVDLAVIKPLILIKKGQVSTVFFSTHP